MKNKIKSAAVKIPVVVLLLIMSQSVFAGIENNVPKESSLSAAQVILYFIILVAAIVLPAFKNPIRTVKK